MSKRSRRNARRQQSYSAGTQNCTNDGSQPARQVRRHGNSLAGITVNEITANNHISVFACIRAKAETVATLPCPTYKRLPSRGKERVADHAVHRMFNESPDGILSAVNFREALISHVEGWGNGYAEIEFVGVQSDKLHLLPPNKVTPERTKSGKLEYKVVGSGSNVRIPDWKMLHVAGLGFDGTKGYSPITIGRQAIGLSIASEAFGAAYFGNGSRGSAILTTPNALSPQARANILDSIDAEHQGVENAHRLMIFEEGLTLQQIGFSPEDSQFLGTRLFQLQEICRLFRIQPAVVGDLSHGTFSNNEQQMTSFVVHTIRPLCRRLENEINRKLFTEAERKEFFAEHLIDGLMRGDWATRNAAYATGRQWGWWSVNDVREKENENGIGEEGDIYLNPMNMVPAAAYLQPAQAPQQAQPQQVQQVPMPRLPGPTAVEKSQAPATDSGEAVTASLYCIQDNVERMLRREADSIRYAAKKPKDFLQQVEKFYEGHGSVSARALEPSVATYKALTNRDGVPEILADVLVTKGREQLLELSGSVSADQLAQAVEEWITQRQAKAIEILGLLG